MDDTPPIPENTWREQATLDAAYSSPVLQFVSKWVMSGKRGEIAYDAVTDQLTAHVKFTASDLIYYPGLVNVDEVWVVFKIGVGSGGKYD